MSRIKVSEVPIYEVEGKRLPLGQNETLEVKSHPAYSNQIMLRIPRGEWLTVYGGALIREIHQAMNTGTE